MSLEKNLSAYEKNKLESNELKKSVPLREMNQKKRTNKLSNVLKDKKGTIKLDRGEVITDLINYSILLGAVYQKAKGDNSILNNILVAVGCIYATIDTIYHIKRRKKTTSNYL